MLVKVVKILRWFARILAGLLILILLAFFVGEGIPNPVHLSHRELLLFIAFLVMISGLLFGWRKEGISSLLVLGGFVFFVVINHGIRLNFIFATIPLTGILFLIVWLLKKKLRETIYE